MGILSALSIASADAQEVEGDSVVLDLPRIGDEFAYAGSDDSSLIVRFVELGSRLDGGLRTHDVLVANWTYVGGGADDEALYFEESISLGSGLIVQQVARCGLPPVSPGQSCGDERALVLLAAGGLPAGFGAAPFWLEPHLSAGIVAVPAFSVLWGMPEVKYHVAADSGCMRVSSLEAGVLRILDQGTVRGPFWLCDGSPVPAAFVSGVGVTFHLASSVRGATDVPITEDWSVWETAVQPPMSAWTYPLVVHDDADPSPFSVEDAHVRALEFSSRYRDVIEAGGLVLGANHVVAAYGTVGVPGVFTIQNVIWHDRSLYAWQADGTGVKVAIRRESGPLGANGVDSVDQTYSLVDEADVSRPVSFELIPDQQVNIGAAAALGTELTRTDLEPLIGPRIYPALGFPAVTRYQFDLKLDGTILTVWLHDPTPIAPGVAAPYESVFDGPSGAILWITLDRRDLPIMFSRPVPVRPHAGADILDDEGVLSQSFGSG